VSSVIENRLSGMPGLPETLDKIRFPDEFLAASHISNRPRRG
jgi:hypothetical protein